MHAVYAYFIIILTMSCALLSGVKVCRRKVAGIRGSQTERNIQASKIRIVRMLITVAVFFALSWLPLYSIKLRILFGSKMQGEEKALMQLYLLPIFQWLGSANSCVNPFIYCFFSTQFRRSILLLVKQVASAVCPCCCASVYTANRPQQCKTDASGECERARIDMTPILQREQ